MSSFDTTPLNVYLIIVCALAPIAAVFALSLATYEIVHHRRGTSRPQNPSGVAGSVSPPFVDHLVAVPGDGRRPSPPRDRLGSRRPPGVALDEVEAHDAQYSS